MSLRPRGPAPRSYLYVPGDRLDHIERAASRGADALILDLEDAVAPARKDAARETVAASIQGLTDAGATVWVRVNAGSRLHDDVRAVVAPGLAGIVVPKATSALVEHASAIVATAERAAALVEGSVAVTALIETAGGVLEAASVARAPRVVQLGLGEADLAADLGIVASDDEREFLPLRLQVGVASAAAGRNPPVGPVATDFRDLDRLRVSTERLRRQGFGARSTIHPAQVAVVNDVFTPSDEEVERARDLVQRFDESIAAGDGVATDADGRMIDEAVARSARAILERAELS